MNDNSGQASIKTIFRKKVRHYNKADPVAYLDTKIRELQELIGDITSLAIVDLQDKLKFERTKKFLQGFSITGGAITFIVGDYVINNYEIKDTKQMYFYGFVFCLGVGFGLILKSTTSPSPKKYNCGSTDYYDTLERYGLTFDTGDIESQVI